MIHVTLEEGLVGDTERHDTSFETGNWEPLATVQCKTKDQGKALMLDNVLEMMNDENLNPDDRWFRLVYREVDNDLVKITEVEEF